MRRALSYIVLHVLAWLDYRRAQREQAELERRKQEWRDAETAVRAGRGRYWQEDA